jgi:phosphoribosylglycinamide formyltransferase 1
LFKIAVLISGSGSDLQSIMDGIESGHIKASIEMVISDRKDAYGIERAKSRGINTYVFDRSVYGKNVSSEVLKLIDGEVDLVVLAGFLSILQDDIIRKFKDRIINIHPSLIPAFCGKGMYGMKVHESAIEYGVKVSGCTVHFVDEGTDSGAIICQKVVPVYPGDTAKALQQRILVEEHKVLPEVVKLISEGRVRVEGRKVFIVEED